jgi:hypothetical protein
MRETLKQGDIGQGFDHLRKTYPQRRELSHFKVSPEMTEFNQLKLLGFSAV